MGKLPLSARKFRKKKGALKSTIKHQRFLREKRQKEKLKQQRLLNEEPEIEEEVEQQGFINFLLINIIKRLFESNKRSPKTIEKR